MSRFLSFIDSLSLKNKLIIIFLTASVLPVGILGVISFKLASNEIMSKEIMSTLYRLESMARDVSAFLSERDLVSINLSLDRDVQALASRKEPNIKFESAVMKLLYDYKHTRGTTALGLYFLDGRLYTNDRRGSAAAAFQIPHQTQPAGGGSLGSISLSTEQPSIPLTRSIVDLSTLKPVGTVLVCIEEAAVFSVYRNLIFDLDAELFIIDKDGLIVSHRMKSLLGHTVQETTGTKLRLSGSSGYEQALGEGRQQVFIFTTHKKTGWKFVCVKPLDDILASTQYIKTYTILLSFTMVFFCFILSFFLSSRITVPIQVLISVMGEVETGRRNRFPSEHYGDEIGTLGNAFNRMIDRLDEMMKKNAEAERKKREAEYRALEFQINPHFLYNTLSSIVWLTSKDKKEESMHMTKDLSTLFRISISKGKDIISVKDEIDHVRCYLNIQGIRYSDEFDVSYDVDPAILEYRSLKLVLQPLTENAIYHGIKNLDRKGHISIRGYAADEGLIFEVIDDGGAMDEALAENINDFLISGKNEQSFGIGIRNVHDRIRFYFGEGYGLSFQIRGGMTVARVVMPIIEEDPPVVYYPGR